MREIFDYKDYKIFLEHQFEMRKEKSPGVQRLFAEALGCKPPFVSQILKDKSQLSMEQSLLAAKFLGLSDVETDYFVLLVQLSRAGTNDLKEYVQKQLDEKLKQFLNLKKRFNITNTLSETDEVIYFSNWIYSAIHVLTSTPRGQTISSIATALSLSEGLISEAMAFLIKNGLVEKTDNGFTMGVTRLHLGKDSPMLAKHHTNWRLQAINHIQSKSLAESVHYSSVVSLTEEDLNKIKRIMVDAIDKTKSTIKQCEKPEILACISLDLFELISGISD